MDASIDQDVATVGRLDAVPTILEAVARTTGMRFTAVARVTETTWTACAVYDQINFGLKPGGELVLETTICNEIRQHHQPVVFGHASQHPYFSNHHTLRFYGLESYISIPIMGADGSFFGTLCAIDSHPAKLDDPNIVRTLELFAKLIASQLEAEERQARSEMALLDAQATARLRDQFIRAGARPALAGAVDQHGRGSTGACTARRRRSPDRQAHPAKRPAHGRADRQRARFRTRPAGRRHRHKARYLRRSCPGTAARRIGSQADPPQARVRCHQ